MPRRMAGYIGRAIEQHGLPIYSSVIYLRRNAGRRNPGYYIQELPGHRVVVQYKVIRLSEIEGQDIIDREYAGLLPFAPLMKHPSGIDSEAWLLQCIHVIDAFLCKFITCSFCYQSLLILLPEQDEWSAHEYPVVHLAQVLHAPDVCLCLKMPLMTFSRRKH